MKDSYPRTRVFPYVLLGIVLFCCALTPQAWWQQIREGLGPWQANPVAPVLQVAEHEPFVVIERDRPRPAASITAASVQREDVAPAPPTVSGPAPGPTNREVWIPPKGWVPRPIEPLRVTPKPPVANRIRRNLPRERAPLPLAAPPQRQILEGSKLSTAPPAVSPPIDLPEIDLTPPTPARQPESDLPHPQPPRSPKTALADLTPPPTHAQGLTWPVASELRVLLNETQGTRLAEWAATIRQAIDELESLEVGAPEQQQILETLQAAARQVPPRGGSPWESQQYLRIRFALARRLAIWEPLAKLAAANDRGERQSIAQGHVRPLLRELAAHTQWPADIDPRSWQATEPVTAELAERALRTLHTSMSAGRLPGSESQHMALSAALHEYVAASVPLTALLSALEDHGEHASHETAARVVTELQRVSVSPSFRPVIDAVQLHYRNANARLAITEELLNQLFPAMHQYAEQVRDRILGADVRGQNHTLANLSVQLIPDDAALRFRLLAQGEVDSRTASTKGPVTLFNRGKSTFTAGKEFRIDFQGASLAATQTQVRSGNRLIRLQSELDSIPLVGWFVRELAAREQEEKQGFLRAEMARRVRRSAQQRMDKQVTQRWNQVEQQFHRKVMEPLQEMQLDPQALEMRTTEQRVIFRGRLASPFQLASHTPRPRARADSKLSLQLHQSSINNLIEQMDWRGRRLTLENLLSEASARLGLVLSVPNEEHRDVEIAFADRHPIDVEFDRGRIAITLHIAELAFDGRRWKNFSARGIYRADARKLDVALVREEGIQLISDRLRLGDQVALRGIFTRVFAKNRRLEILRETLARQERLKDLRLTQLTIRDGWICLALGDDRARLTSVKRPKAH